MIKNPAPKTLTGCRRRWGGWGGFLPTDPTLKYDVTGNTKLYLSLN